ncbi:hypothetical protein BRC65_02525 [Halobacteriales archaeon QH_2_65_14]|nr:MAG: hypothetical protein BRC65_02525 [Halobacteriales archaeon QH_2_65_14]
MMVAPVDIVFGLIIAVGAVLSGLGYYSYRRCDQLGVTALAAFAAVLGLGALFGGLLGLFIPSRLEDPDLLLWGQLSVLFWGLSAVPWLVFSLQYTGRASRIRLRTVGLLYVPFGIVPVIFLINLVEPEGTVALISIISSLVIIYCLGIVLLGSFLVVQASRSYVHLSVRNGVALAATPVITFMAINSVSILQQASELAAAGLFLAGFGLATLAFGGALLRGEFLDSTPAVETIGERAIAQETDDLVFVVDGDDSIVKCNETATETLNIPRETLLGKPLRATLGDDSGTLADMATMTLETDEGTRRYDPQVSRITAGDDAPLGAVLSLRDVTERELREQRLAVLNRVLRHNLRNKVEVIKSHAEVLHDGRDDHADTIVTAADSIAGLGQSARTIDQFVSDSAGTTMVDLAETVRSTVETVERALAGALESAIDNAISYADSAVTISVEEAADGYEVTITDDGPGIPDGELESLDTGTETALQHGTGLGLWQLKWAVTTMGGDLAFDTTDGTTVRFTVPDQGDEGTEHSPHRSAQ